MNIKETLDMYEIVTRTNELKLSESDRSDALEAIKNVKNIVRDYYKDYITKQLQLPDGGCPSSYGYDSWYCFFGDCDGANVEEYLRELFTEDDCQRIWDAAHINGTEK